jgi:3-phenylpropionate/cinnamic acid dioxygenase small subunit
MDNDLLNPCAELIYLEAAYLDEKRWAEWLGLYTDDAEFWVPAWDAAAKPTSDPQSQLSLIYYNSRSGLEDRVWRIKSGKSLASDPLIRTCHMITNLHLTGAAKEGHSCVNSHWQVQVYRPAERRVSSYFGFYEHLLRREPDGLRIARKKIILLNDEIESVLDINHV